MRLLEQFLRAGIEPAPALKTLNSALALRGETGGAFTTIDLLALRRSTGEATLYKYGAAPPISSTPPTLPASPPIPFRRDCRPRRSRRRSLGWPSRQAAILS